MDKQKKESGFALLMTLIVVGAVLSVGLSMLDLTLKQVQLSTNAKESEIAFHAANAGLECAQYLRRLNSDEMEAGVTVASANLECFGGAKAAPTPSITPTDIAPDTVFNTPGEGAAYLYNYQFSWNNSCTRVKTLVINSDVTGPGVTISPMDTMFPAYPDDDNNKECLPGSICTIISVQGYNKPCTVFNSTVDSDNYGNLESYGVVQREVLLQL